MLAEPSLESETDTTYAGVVEIKVILGEGSAMVNKEEPTEWVSWQWRELFLSRLSI
jgi:hypothetical protein